jgi:hypothetical protein
MLRKARGVLLYSILDGSYWTYGFAHTLLHHFPYMALSLDLEHGRETLQTVQAPPAA